MSTLSPAGFVLQYGQATPASLASLEPLPVIVSPNLPGQVFEASGPKSYVLDTLPGEQGTIDGVIDVGAPGTSRPVLTIHGDSSCPSAYIIVFVDANNSLMAQVTDAAGVVVATSQVATGAMNSGSRITFRLAWKCTGDLPYVMQSNFGGAYLSANGIRPEWTIVSGSWDAWRPGSVFIGGSSGGVIPFNGTIYRIAISPLLIPDAQVRTWSLPATAPAPVLVSADIAHLGDLTISGTDLFSPAGRTTNVSLTGTAAVELQQVQIGCAGGVIRSGSVYLPAVLVPGIDGTTSCTVTAHGYGSNTVPCTMPVDVPTITAAAIQPVSLNLVVDGTFFLSRTPNVSSIDITAPGAVTLTRAAVVAGGGTWTDSQIVIPGALVPGITSVSTCAVTSNLQTTAYHAITGP